MGPQKVVSSIHNIIICGKMMATELLFNFQEEVIVSSPIRRIGCVIDKLEYTFVDSSHDHCGHVLEHSPGLRALLLSPFHAGFASFSSVAVSAD